MSLMSMRHKMASKQTASYILWLLIIVFVIGIYLLSNPGKYGTPKNGNALPGAENVIATVSGGTGATWSKAITAGELNDKFADAQQKADDATSSDSQRFDVGNVLQQRQNIFDQLVATDIQDEVVHEFGIHLFNWDLSSYATEAAKIQLDRMHTAARTQAAAEAAQAAKVKPVDKAKSPQPETEDALFKQSEQNFAQRLGATDMTNLDDAKLTRLFVHFVMTKDDNDIAPIDVYAREREIGKLVISKNLTGSIGATNEAMLTNQAFVTKLNTKEVKASWIFVAATEQTAKGVQAAIAKATQLRDQIVAKPDSFASVAKAQSNDPMSSSRGGSLDWVKFDNQYSMVQPVVEYLAFATEKNAVSPVLQVALPSMFQQGQEKIGAAFVRVEDLRDGENAKSFDWNKDSAGATLLAKERFEMGFAASYLQLARGQATIQRATNELKYYDAATNAPADANKLIATLQTDPTLPSIIKEAFAYMVANQETDPGKKAAELEGVYESGFAGDQAASIKMSIGQAYIDLKQKEKAIETFKWIATLTSNSEPQNMPGVHQQLKAAFTKLGDTADAQDMDAWIKKHPQNNSGFGGGMPINMSAH